MRITTLSTIAFLMFALASFPITKLSGADAAEPPVLRIVFFTPSDVDPPDGVRKRLKEYVDYSQMFFAKWMNHWGYECKDPLAVRRDKDGFPEVLYVKGRHTEASGRYRQLGFQGEVVETACQKYDLDPKGQVWWIFTYKGPERRGFRGGGNAQKGGTSTSIYDPNDRGHLRLDDELASDEQARIKSKGSIHELGHALGLPHIGPLEKDKLGNSLMGPVIKAYRAKYPQETRVYLTKASAALLWKHPLFSGTTKDRDITPTLELDEFQVTHDKESAQFVVSGKVISDRSAHSIVIGNESKATRSGYWMKTFAGRVAADGSFRVVIDELDHTDGQLRVVCCFNNGAIIGKATGGGLSTGFVKQYRFGNGEFSVIDGWGPQQSGLFDRRERGPRRRPPNRPGQAPQKGQTVQKPTVEIP